MSLLKLRNSLLQGGRCIHTAPNLLAAAPSGQMQSIKSLRELSGAPMSDVKAALVDAEWDADQAFQLLRKKGLAAAQKKAARNALEGLVCVATSDTAAVAVEVNTETDFAARNAEFTQMLPRIAQAVLASEGEARQHLAAEDLGRIQMEDGSRVQDAVQHLSGFLRENIQARRAERISVREGIIGSYLHLSPSPGLGRMASLVALQCPGKQLAAEEEEHLKTLGHQLAMHAVAARPSFLTRDEVPDSALSAEREVLREQALRSGKSAKFVDKMVEGRMGKYFEDHCFLEQRFVLDDAQRVREVLASTSKQLGATVSISAVSRLQCGEGLDQGGQTSFADQVADTVQQAAQAG